MNIDIAPLTSNRGTDANRPLLGLQILVVDDSNDYRDLLTLRLQRLGAEITPVDSGFAALEEVQKKPFDVILMDIQMPKMDGLRTIRRIRELGYKSPIITVTALKDILKLSPSETRDIAAHAGKPTDVPDLVETILGVLAIRDI